MRADERERENKAEVVYDIKKNRNEWQCKSLNQRI